MQSRLALVYLDELLIERTGKTFAKWVGDLRGPDPEHPEHTWMQVWLALVEVTRRQVGSPETVRRWFEKPL
jgi:hypothetical protein